MAHQRVLSVEDALRWAFREELPKARRSADAHGLGFASARAGWESFVELLTKIDVNRYGVVPDRGGEPHPDAVRLGEAVMALDGLELGVPEDWNPIEDWGDLGEWGRATIVRALAKETIVDASGARRFAMTPSRLVVHFAVMGDHEEWRGERPALKVVLKNGAPQWFAREQVWVGDEGGNPKLGHWHEVEVSGFDQRRRRPKPGAYKRYYLDPDPELTIFARARWEMWRAVVDMLGETVGELATIRLKSCALPARPWTDGARERYLWRAAGSTVDRKRAVVTPPGLPSPRASAVRKVPV